MQNKQSIVDHLNRAVEELAEAQKRAQETGNLHSAQCGELKQMVLALYNKIRASEVA